MRFFFFFSNELHLMNADATSMLQLLLPRSIASQIHTRLHNPLSITSSLPFRNQTVSHPRQCKSSSFKQCSCCFMFFPLNPFWCSNAAGFGFSHGALNSWIVEKQQKIKARLDGAFSVLDVYVLQELLPPFFIGLTAFTLLGLSFGVGPNVATILEKAGMRWCSILSCCQLIALRIPISRDSWKEIETWRVGNFRKSCINGLHCLVHALYLDWLGL
ncbi:hypothetical protein O6H91_16G081600 [Diphasiastrum complanatum]|uniref:Uncharacterized protein n=1 Tax=Diphasiastrum complanatum TaxID=34168 RepID=A0ACC2BE25_DIPCM|nr:hypothetical protein O6H91_16G081600 [Diphasiastrum complanatum]